MGDKVSVIICYHTVSILIAYTINCIQLSTSATIVGLVMLYNMRR
jgi:hypothetical protein